MSDLAFVYYGIGFIVAGLNGLRMKDEDWITIVVVGLAYILTWPLGVLFEIPAVDRLMDRFWS